MDRAAASSVRPFIGLRPFAYEDRAFFFGRDRQIERLLALLAERRLLSVIGSSGSGKSSLIRAGLLPRLTRSTPGSRGWIEVRPGESPIRHLAEALAGPPPAANPDAGDRPPDARADRIEMLLLESSFGLREALPLVPQAGQGPLVILVDQFEEIFRFADLRRQHTADPLLAAEQRDEATRFVQLLLTAAVDPDFAGRIILTMRSDFIGDCARFHGLSEAVSQSQYLVPALTRDQRAAAITQPVESAHGSVDPALVQRLLNDSNEDPDQLPILQHVMMRCWQRAAAENPAEPRLTLETYAAVGGFSQALSQHAEELLAELAAKAATPSDPRYALPAVTQRLFQALTETDSGNRAIRRPQQLGDLAAVVTPDDADATARAEADAAVRHVVQRFADPDCSFLRVSQQRELRNESVVDIGHEALIRRWDRLGGGGRNWVQEELEDREKLLDLERLARTGSVIAADRLPEYERWWRERRPNQIWARRYAPAEANPVQRAADLLARSRAKIEKRIRDSRRNRRLLQRLVAAVVLLVLAFGAYLLWQNQEEARAESERREAEARAADARALAANQDRSRLVAVIGADALARSGAGQALLVALYGLEGQDGLYYVPELEALAYRALQAPFATGLLNLQVRPAVAFLRDGTLLTLDGNRLRYWNPATLEPLRGEIQLPRTGINVSTNRADDRVLVSGFDWAALYSTSGTGSGQPNFQVIETGAARGIFSPDGKHVLTGSFAISPKLWSVGAAGASLRVDFATMEPPLAGASALAFSDDSRLLAIGTREGRVHIYDLASLTGMPTLDPRKVSCTSSDPSAAGQEGASDSVAWLSFDPADANRLLVTGNDGKVCLWTIAPTGGRPLGGLAGRPVRAQFAPQGDGIAVGTSDGRVWIWDQKLQLYRGAPLHAGENAVRDLEFHPGDADLLVSATSEGDVALWDLRPALSRGLTATEPATAAAGEGLASGAGVTLVAEGEGYAIRSSNPAVPARALALPPGLPPPAAAAFSPDGSWLAWAPARGRLLLFALARSAGPMTDLGDADSEWSAVGFAGGPDRVVARTSQGELYAWRYFGDLGALIAYGESVLPKTVDGPPLALSDAELKLLRGEFRLFPQP